MKWVFGLFIVLIILLSGCSKPADNKNYDVFAQCLTDKGAVMYGTEWCGHCKDQKAMFGNSFKLIRYVDCDRYQNDCVAAGVQGYPTWKINNTNYQGSQNMYVLATKTGCVVELEKAIQT